MRLRLAFPAFLVLAACATSDDATPYFQEDGGGGSASNADGASSGGLTTHGGSSGGGSSGGGSSGGGSSSGGSSGGGSSSGGSSGGGSSSGGSSSGGSFDAGGGDGGHVGSFDAGQLPDLDAGTTVTIIQPVSGTPKPTTAPLQGPGLILMGGGTDVDSAFVWMHDTLAGSSTATLGNVVVLRADLNTDNAYTPYIFGLAPFQSVMSIYVGGSAHNGTPATASDLAIAAYYIGRADAVFFAGGDQADYVSWKGSPLMQAVSNLYARGGVIGGTSAGCAILSPAVFDSVSADANGNGSVATADAVANPYETNISFTRGMLAFPTLPNVIADMHFVTRDRMGRLAAFVARQYADGAASSGVVGVGVDESNALLVDKHGKATLAQQPSGTQASSGSGAYVVQSAGAAATCASGKPLVYSSLKVTRLASAGSDSFDFSKGCGNGVQFTMSVDGSRSSPYSPSPYTAKGTTVSCP